VLKVSTINSEEDIQVLLAGLYEWGFMKITAKKGSYVDGHKRDDVEYRKVFEKNIRISQ